MGVRGGAQAWAGGLVGVCYAPPPPSSFLLLLFLTLAWSSSLGGRATILLRACLLWLVGLGLCGCGVWVWVGGWVGKEERAAHTCVGEHTHGGTRTLICRSVGPGARPRPPATTLRAYGVRREVVVAWGGWVQAQGTRGGGGGGWGLAAHDEEAGLSRSSSSAGRAVAEGLLGDTPQGRSLTSFCVKKDAYLWSIAP